jgi:LysR family glycine cleavage system transcriptional activator
MWLKAAEADNVDASHGLRFDTASACITAAIEGAGVALARTALIGSDLAVGHLVKLFELSLPSDLGYYVVYPRRSEKLPKVMAFRDWLFEEVREQPDS